MKQAFLINMGGPGNIGDRAMALNVIRQLREKDSQSRILVGPHTLDFMVEEFDLSRCPYFSHCLSRWGAVEKRFGKSNWLLPLKGTFYFLDSMLVAGLIILRRYLRIRPPGQFMEAALAQAIADSDVIFFCGGGYITDIGVFDSRTNLIMALFGIMAGKPVIMSGQGLGPFYTKLSRFLLKIVIPRVDYISFRDASESMELLKEMGIKWKRGSAVGDDALSLPEIETLDCGDSWSGVRLGVNLRISPFTPNLTEKVEEFKEFIRMVAEDYNWQVNFFVFETWRPWEEDILRTIISETGITNFVIHKTEDPRKALYLSGRCHIAVGISYHFIVFCLKHGIPTIALYSGEWYRSKMVGLLEWYGRNDWTLDVEKMSAKNLAELCFSIYKESDNSVRAELIKKTEEMERQCTSSIERALAYLKTP